MSNNNWEKTDLEYREKLHRVLAEDLAYEILKARENYPSNQELLMALVEEIGEAVEDMEAGNKEWLEVAGVALRLYLEGSNKSEYFIQHARKHGGEARRLLEVMGYKRKRKVDEMTPRLSRITETEIIRTVAGEFGVNVSDIHSSNRSPRMVEPRWLAMFLIRDLLGYSYEHIGKIIGVHHSCVVKAVQGFKKNPTPKQLRVQASVMEILMEISEEKKETA